MSERQFKKIWLAFGLLMLIVTAPSWLNPRKVVLSNYDAPWIYPALNPSISH